MITAKGDMRQVKLISINILLIFVTLIIECNCATGDLTREQIDALQEQHLDNNVGFVPLYRGDSVSEFLEIGKSCIKYGCGDNCTVEPCNRFVLEDIKLAYDIVKAFKTKLDSQYENVILMLMTAIAICLSLYLWFVGHFSIRGTWIYSFFYPDEEYQDPCQGIPMRLYTEMQFETLFDNEPRLKKIQKEEKKRLEKKKMEVDKSVQEFFHARPYLRKLENDPSVLADLMAMQKKREEEEDNSSATEEEQHYTDEKKVAEEAMHKLFEEKAEEERKEKTERHVNFPDIQEPDKGEKQMKNIFLHDKERQKRVQVSSLHSMEMHSNVGQHHGPHHSQPELPHRHSRPDHHYHSQMDIHRRSQGAQQEHPPNGESHHP